jgi:hypothetical protein
MKKNLPLRFERDILLWNGNEISSRGWFWCLQKWMFFDQFIPHLIESQFTSLTEKKSFNFFFFIFKILIFETKYGQSTNNNYVSRHITLLNHSIFLIWHGKLIVFFIGFDRRKKIFFSSSSLRFQYLRQITVNQPIIIMFSAISYQLNIFF